MNEITLKDILKFIKEKNKNSTSKNDYTKKEIKESENRLANNMLSKFDGIHTYPGLSKKEIIKELYAIVTTDISDIYD